MDRIGAVLVDTYRIERLIAEGGMGAVYEASHLRIPKKFAIKFLKVSLLDNPVALLRFRREAEVIATLDHPHIVSLLDYNITSDGVPYTILEYLEGEHLGDRVNRGRLPLGDVLRIADAMSSALTTAHDKGIVHRDLKPENVILGPTGGVKVVDFGIAKLRGGQELTAFNSILGTITYMAPEQLLAGQIDARADQFALGAIVYEMLSGSMPFGCEGTIPEIAERVLRRQPAPIAGYPQELFDVVLRALAKDANLRYPNVDSFFAAFRDVARPLLGEMKPAVASISSRNLVKQTVERPTTVPATDEGLAELPGEATSISMNPIMTPPKAASAIDSSAPMPALATVLSSPSRVDSRPEIRVGMKNDTLRSAPIRVEQTTDQTGDLRRAIVTQLGQRGGIVIGLVLGVVIAAIVGLLVLR